MRLLRRIWIGLCCLLSLLAFGCRVRQQKRRQWAVPLDEPEIPNFHRVSKDLYRGGQPSPEGFGRLKALGVKTVVNLRTSHSDEAGLAGLGMLYEEIPATAWTNKLDEQAVRFLRILEDKRKLPVFVHCGFGGDRTGAMVAVYRLAICGWSRQEALEEMCDEQFEFHGIWDDLVKFVQELDVQGLCRRAGIKPPPGRQKTSQPALTPSPEGR
jgi:protein tyrosine phosphatase (PTP) superfamily phosphohydrolase (DUF442 family)